jgi:hypothetical protein
MCYKCFPTQIFGLRTNKHNANQILGTKKSRWIQMSSLSGGIQSAARNISDSDSIASPESRGSPAPAQVGKSVLESDCILHFLAEGGGERERGNEVVVAVAVVGGEMMVMR